MVKPRAADGLNVAPFLQKSYEMVDDQTTDSIISWSNLGDSFVIWDMTKLSVLLLPRYFKHSNFSSFMRQLNIYGFRKVDTDHWEYANDGFIKGQKYLLKNITRRKHPHYNEPQKKSHSQQSGESMGLVNRVDNSRLLEDVESLKHDKNVLMQEFVKLRQLQETSENKLHLVREQVQGIEKNLHQMLSFLLMAMENPGFLVQIFHPNENCLPMLEHDGVNNEARQSQLLSDGRLLRYKTVHNGLPNTEFSSGLGSVKASEPNSNQTFDGTNDAFCSFDLLKILMDESSKFTLDRFILPDFPDDGSWKDLLESPFKETKQDGKGPIGPTISNTNSMQSRDFELLMEQIRKSCGLVDNQPEFEGTDLEDDENLDILTEEKEPSISRTNSPP